MGGRTLEELGLAVAPRDEPLSYPGAWPRESGLLKGDLLLPLAPPPLSASPPSSGLRPLMRDPHEREDPRATFEGRVPVLAVGSNACPGQLRHKMAEYGITSPIPMVRARVTGIDVGVSAHVSLMGYVSAAPFSVPDVVRELFLIWLDAEQLAVVDASEGVTSPTGAYDRAWLPAPDVRIEPEFGQPLPGAYAYVNRHGVLHDGDGRPRGHPGERALLTELLVATPRLRELFGVTPEEFCARARLDRELCARGTRVFAEEKLVVASGLERYVRGQRTEISGTGPGSPLAPPSW
ncbi:hypothetical protein ACFS5L_18095 [Streptomyces phyllanthi]|uniref:Gamma-glutamylcyclotransferase n=1 Tax=Streptomyces phyllanthi TaxID=1803180 RepID=A0A5N8WAG8_9ACTN|nr:hypothetical protein [Streptomyces phyllanthi]MPY44480.1 hypothetical protein [Streptomyces phyllanthi]